MPVLRDREAAVSERTRETSASRIGRGAVARHSSWARVWREVALNDLSLSITASVDAP
jgi:hypothetical protein